MSQDHVRRGKVFQYGKGSNSPVGRGTVASAPCYSDLSDTDVPDDDDFLTEWDEWSEIEKGKGPKATWNNDKVYDFNQGKVVAAATLHNTKEIPKTLVASVMFSFHFHVCHALIIVMIIEKS